MTPQVLTRLLPAGGRSVSTKQAVSGGAKAVPAAHALALALWGWVGAAVLVFILALAFGAARVETAGAAALALAPALLGFILLPRLDEIWARFALIGAWLLAAFGLTAGTGGAGSPLASVFATPLALAVLLAAPRLAWIAGACVVGYGAAVWLSLAAPMARLGPWPALTSAAALGFAGALLVIRPARPQRAQATAERVAEISHELRTPLTHILGFAEMIQAQIFGEIDKRYVDYAGLIRSSGGTLLDMVNGLLDLSKIQAGRYELEYETFDARAIAHEVMRLSAGSAEPKQITLVEQAPDDPLMVRADVRALRQMLINTVGNAIKFTPAQGRVVLSARAEDGELIFDTTDSGPGIPVEERARLGRRYERGGSGANAPGTGLGLALVRALAQLHGGALTFHEAPGGGALVRISMPVLAD